MPREPSAIKYHGVINNPEKKGITSESLLTLLRNIATIIYFAFGFHTAPTTGTTHIHLFIWFKNSTTFSRVKKLLPEGTHIEACKGNAEQNIDYITNSGPHKDKDTYVKDSLVTSAPKPPDDAMKRMTSKDVIEAMEAGKSLMDIVRMNPALLKFNKLNDFLDMETALLEEQFGNQMRDLEVIYVQGETRTGKTYNIFQTYGFDNVYRAIMGKPKPFDGYHSQDILLLDEFRENIPLAVMLMYLDKYPCTLEARYHDRVAAYTKVFIVSNWRFEEQYTKAKKEDYKAWVARFSYIRVYTGYCTYDEYTPADYFKMIKGKSVKPVRSVRPKTAIITPPPAPRLLLPPHCEDTSSKGDDRNE